MPLALLFAAAMNVVSYRSADSVVLHLYGAQEADAATAPDSWR